MTDDLLPDGVYLGLEPESYFKQGLGSTDLITLHFFEEGWQYREPSRATKEQACGSGLHAILLEGVDAYERRFAAQPDAASFPGLCRSTDEIIAALKAAGLDTSSGTSKFRKADWALAARRSAPHVAVWDNIMEDFEAGVAGKTPIPAADDRALRLMHTIAVENPEVQHLFSRDHAGEHPPLAEVSVIKTLADGTRRRWRIDRMFPAFDMDVKSIGNFQGRKLEWLIGETIAKRGMDIQRADYIEGRQAAYEFIADGFQVHGGTIEQRKFLKSFPDIAPTWDWVWLFYQKPDPKGRAPIILPLLDITETDGFDRASQPIKVPSVIVAAGLAKKARALATYRRCMATFGPDRPWSRVMPLHYTDDTFSPRVVIPHWIADIEPETKELSA